MLKSSSKLITLLFIVILLAIASVNISMQSPAGLLTTPDSLSYLDIARNIDQGNGALASNRTLQATALGDNAYIEQRLWPKLYPIVLSVFIERNYGTSAVRSLSALLLTFTALLVFFIVRRFSSNVLAFLTAVLFMHTLPINTVYAFVWSETLFIPLFLLFSYAAFRYGELQINQTHLIAAYSWLAIFCLSLLGLAYTRYIGIGMVLVLLPLLLISVKTAKSIAACLLAGLILSIGIGAMLYGNYQISGSISGGVRQVSDKTFSDNVIALLDVLIVHFPSVLVCLVIFILAASANIVLLKSASKLFSNRVSAFNGAAVFFSLALLYIFLLLGLRSYSSFDDIDVRLISPAFALLYLSAILTWLGSIKQLSGNKYFFLPASFALFFCLATSYQGYLSLHQSINSLRFNSSTTYPVNGRSNYNNFTFSEKTS